MLPLLPALGGLARGAISGGASIARGGVRGITNAVRGATRGATNSARTATRNANRGAINNAIGAGAGGGTNAGANRNNINSIGNDLNNVSQSLQEQANALQQINERLQQTQTQASKLSKIWHGMGGILNKALVTPLKKAFGFLGSMLRTARNLVMALGALAIGTFFANAKGQIEKHRTAGQSGVDARQLKAYNRAKAMHGLSEEEFNLANLQTLLGSQDSYAILGQLGLKREDLAGKDGIEAMEILRRAAGKKLESVPENGVVWNNLADAIMKTMGVDVRNKHNRKHFTDKGIQSFNKDMDYFYKNLKDTKSLVEAQKAIARVQYTIKDLGESLSVWLAPYVTRIANAINQFLNDPEKTKGFGEIMDKIFGAIGRGMTKLRSVFTNDVLSQAVDSIAEIGSALLDITEKILPHFLKGLDVLGAILKDLANFLDDPQAWWDEKKGVTKELAEGKINQARGYGTAEQQLNAIVPWLGTVLNKLANGKLSQYQNEAIEQDFDRFYEQKFNQKQKRELFQSQVIRKEVTLKLDTGAGQKVIFDTSSIAGGAQ